MTQTYSEILIIIGIIIGFALGSAISLVGVILGLRICWRKDRNLDPSRVNPANSMPSEKDEVPIEEPSSQPMGFYL